MAVDVSIAVCTRNSGVGVLPTLEAVQRSADASGLSFELLCVDSASTDDTAQVLERFASNSSQARVLRDDRPGLSRARNHALSEARGTVVAFTDDDCIPEGPWVRALCTPVLNGSADLVAGAVALAPALDKPWLSPYQHQLLASTRDGLGNPPRTFIGANMAMRSSLVHAESFDERLGPGALGFMDDSLLFVQLTSRGARPAFASDALVVHHFDPDRLTASSFVRRSYLQGRGEGWMHWNWGQQGHTPRSYARWLRLELRLARSGGQRGLAGTDADLELVREIGRRREHAVSRWLRRDDLARVHVHQDATTSR